MSYPTIFPPGGTPVFLAAGHGLQEESAYAQVPRGSGHGRARRTCTTVPRVVDVAWFLTPAQAVEVDAWYEDTLYAGALHFTAQVANQGPGMLFWDAVWVGSYDADPFATKTGIHWQITGRLLLTGEGTAIRPTTGELAVEFQLALEGAAVIEADGALEVEFLLRLLGNTALSVEFGLALEFLEPEFLLIEGTDLDHILIEGSDGDAILLEYS